MKVALHDAEKEHFKHKTFPNLALMRISAYHKKNGDHVEWWNPLYRYDRIYSSKVFDFTPTDPYLPDNAIRGGTGYRDIPIDRTLPDEIDNMFPDYSIYPECDYAIGYLTRGCPNHCRWCVVPRKEGDIRPYREWQDIVRHDTDKLVLMDNNILACDYGIHQLESLISSGYRIDLNQGMDARLVDREIAQILSRLSWIRHIRFSCDQKSQIEPIQRTIAQFLEEFIFSVDYTQATSVGVDEIVMSGNSLENLKEAYPDCRFVDLCYPSLDPAYEGLDWCSLKIVFAPTQSGWYLVGLIHSQWTI